MAAEEPERAEPQYAFTDQRLAAALDDIEDGFKPGSAGCLTSATGPESRRLPQALRASRGPLCPPLPRQMLLGHLRSSRDRLQPPTYWKLSQFRGVSPRIEL